MIKIAVIGGDGVGPEVTEVGMNVMKAAAKITGLSYEAEKLDISGSRYLAQGGDPKKPSIPVITDEEIDSLRDYDAIYLGAVGHPSVAPGIIEQGLLLKLRFDLDQYVNLRPVKLLPGVTTPLAAKTSKEIDFVAVRENTEGLYCGQGGVMRKGTADEISTQIMISTRKGAERTIRYAFDTAVRRKAEGYRGEVTLIHKTNVLTHCGSTWMNAFVEIGDAEYPEIVRNYHHVDACCMYMVTKPELYDVIVVPNMFGDIITDLGAAISGGMGMAASGNLNPDPNTRSVSMFEPIHGSAPDIAGQGKANPIAAIMSMAMLLTETGRKLNDDTAIKTGDVIERAIAVVSAKFSGQPMDRLNATTDEIGHMVVEEIKERNL